MSARLHVDRLPCSTCPYRVDTPPGVWDPEEYAKLPNYDDDAPEVAVAAFLCHHSPTTGRDAICRGWLTVHAESVAARLAVISGRVTDAERYAPVEVELYPTGRAAADAGMAGVEDPSPAARRAIDRLTAKQRRQR